MKLRTRLFALVILILLPIVGIEVYDEMDLQARRADEGKDQAIRLVRLVANEQSRVIEGARQLLTALGKTPAVRNRDVASCSDFFTELAHSYPPYVSLMSTDLAGHSVCVGGATEPGGFLGDYPSFKLALGSRAFALGEYSVDARSQQKSIHLAQPYYDTDGKLGGVVSAGLSLDWLNAEIARNPLPPKATISVIDRQGTILARYPDSEKFVGTKISPKSHAYLLSGNEGVQEALGFDGVSRIYSYAPLPGGPSGLTLSVGLDKGEAIRAIQSENRRDILVIVGSAILALLVAGIGARVFITRPIRALVDAAEHWRQGDLNARVTISDTRSEFSRLGERFNAMAAAISLREQELERRVAERTDALKAAMQAQQTTEAALYEARKMETVGRLTGGVAHDFNNLLAAIVGNIELARSRLNPGHAVLPLLAAAIQSANRGAGLVQQLLAFARRQHLRPEVVNLNRHIRRYHGMLQGLLQSDSTIETSLSPEAGLVRVDPYQLEAAMANLASNAREAMPHGGIMRVSTRNVSIAASSSQTGLSGEFVAITVEDTGTGIVPEVLEKVFEPFFTTKPVGAGSGLGLSMVQGFARQSSGAVSIESKVGHGTCVTLYLPQTAEAAARGAVPRDAIVANKGHVLLVGANPDGTAEMLEMSGYAVMTAHDATEAITCLDQAGFRIDVMITDVELPGGMSGLALAAKLRTGRQGIPALLIAGGAEILPNIGDGNGGPSLSKPFNRTALLSAMQHAMKLHKASTGRLDQASALP